MAHKIICNKVLQIRPPFGVGDQQKAC